jgi:hypothetical protein
MKSVSLFLQPTTSFVLAQDPAAAHIVAKIATWRGWANQPLEK